jgi:Dolichyl-phosphate-mannose-protein mannosyltransferase
VNKNPTAQSTSAFTGLHESLTLIITIGLCVKLIFAFALSFGVDESYTIATSRTLDLSYFDHPPMAWWLTSAMRFISGSEHPLILRLPFIFCSTLSTWLIADLTSVLYGKSKAIPATLIFSAAPVLSITSGTWILPDGPLLLFMLACASVLARLLFVQASSPALWIAAGLCGGLALLSKYHGLFLFAGTFVFLVSSPRHRFWLATPWPYLGSLIGLMVFSPVMLWNYRHEWISFLFQSGRAQALEWRPFMPLIILAGQSLFLFPLTWYLLVKSTFQKWRSAAIDERTIFLSCLAAGPIVIVLIVSLWSKQNLFHWAAPGYMMLIPIAADFITTQHKKWLSLSTWGLWALTLCVPLLALLPINWSALGLHDPLMDMRAWSPLKPQIEALYKDMPADSFIASTRWHLTGRLDLALGSDYHVTCLCLDNRGYGIIAPLSDFTHKSALIIVPTYRTDITRDYLQNVFARVEQRNDLTIPSHQNETISFHLFVGYDFKGAAP